MVKPVGPEYPEESLVAVIYQCLEFPSGTGRQRIGRLQSRLAGEVTSQCALQMWRPDKVTLGIGRLQEPKSPSKVMGVARREVRPKMNPKGYGVRLRRRTLKIGFGSPPFPFVARGADEVDRTAMVTQRRDYS